MKKLIVIGLAILVLAGCDWDTVGGTKTFANRSTTKTVTYMLGSDYWNPGTFTLAPGQSRDHDTRPHRSGNAVGIISFIPNTNGYWDVEIIFGSNIEFVDVASINLSIKNETQVALSPAIPFRPTLMNLPNPTINAGGTETGTIYTKNPTFVLTGANAGYPADYTIKYNPANNTLYVTIR